MALLTTPLFKYLDDQEDQMLELLAMLVNIDSGSYDKSGIDRVILILKEKFGELGFDAEVITQAERGNHLLARKHGTSSRRLLLIGHCDTVFEAGTAIQRPFRMDGSRAYGPGVADMKGGLTVMMFALGAIRMIAPSVWNDLGFTVIVNSDEEISSPTSRQIIEAEASQANAICVLEPARPGGEYVTQRKGHGTFYLSITGKSAHAGVDPESGASAIHELCKKGISIQALNNYKSGLTVNIGVVRGGTRPNVVADSAVAEIDVRITALDEGEWISGELTKIAAEVDTPGTHSELTGAIEFPPMPRNENTMQLFRLVQQAGAELGLTLRDISTGGVSDGNYASQYAPTCDGMGPQGGGFHSPDEYIELPTLLERTKILARFITLWHASAK
jgi:glutamate carboxypeptidase